MPLTGLSLTADQDHYEYKNRKLHEEGGSITTVPVQPQRADQAHLAVLGFEQVSGPVPLIARL